MNTLTKTIGHIRKGGRKSILALLMMIIMQFCTVLQAAEYFYSTEGVPHLPVLADTAAVTTPAVNLHVKGAAGADGVIALQEPVGDKIWYIKNQLTSGNLFFSNAGGDKLTILDGGNVGIGMADPLLKLSIGDHDTGLQWLSDGYFGLYTNGNSVIRVDSSRATYIDGRLFAGGIITSSWQTDLRIDTTSREIFFDVSDERLKTITGDYTKGLSGLMGIKPKYFYMNNDEAKRVSAGLIAQNVQEFIPEAAGALPDEDGTLFIVDRTLIATAINAIQEQQGQIEELESENTELRGLLEQMETRLTALEN